MLFHSLTACEKWLDAKPDESLAIPATLKDVEAILGNTSVFNTVYMHVGESSADNYFLTDSAFNAMVFQGSRNAYNWQGDVSQDESPSNWQTMYKQVYTANVALDALESVERKPEEAMRFDRARGVALFLRSRALQALAVAFAPVYEAGNAKQKMGIPLRNTIDFTEPSVRVNLEDTYKQIVDDMIEAAKLLPMTSSHPMIPNQVAAHAYLSRFYLSMGNFESAGKYADSVIDKRWELLNYNSLNANANFPIAARNTEVLYEVLVPVPMQLDVSYARVDSNLYLSFHVNDLRRTVFFRTANNGVQFKGNYTGSAFMFGGMALDEVYLTAAECAVRRGNTERALALMNQLLQTRWKQGTWQSLVGLSAAETLLLILTERRKALLMREIRWMDIKRLSVLEVQHRVTMTRILNGQQIVLAPGANRYALPIPEVVISMTGMEQNPE